MAAASEEPELILLSSSSDTDYDNNEEDNNQDSSILRRELQRRDGGAQPKRVGEWAELGLPELDEPWRERSRSKSPSLPSLSASPPLSPLASQRRASRGRMASGAGDKSKASAKVKLPRRGRGGAAGEEDGAPGSSHHHQRHREPSASPSEDDDEVVVEEVMSSKVTSKKNKNPGASASQRSKSPTQRQREKEAEKAEKAAAKERQRAEREQRKLDQEREKQLKKSEMELRKNSRPGEAFKFMEVLLDPSFAHLSTVTEVLTAAEISYSIDKPPPLENSILFMRNIVFQAMGDDLRLQKQSRPVEEDQLFLYLEPEDIVPKVAAQLGLGGEPSSSSSEDLDFVTYIDSIKSTFPTKKITLLLYGMDAHFKKLKRSQHQEYRERVLAAGGAGDGGSPQKRRRKKNTPDLPAITRFDLQSALIELQLRTGINYRLLNSPKELAHLLVQYTKAIADAPFKRAAREATTFDWYALADSSGSIKVDKVTGEGLRALWLEQLQQFSMVGSETALAITRRYPTPTDLMEAYDRCRNQEEGQALLKDLSVQTGFGPLKKTRRLGPEASKKLYRFFTSTDPERCLGSTSTF